MSKKLDKQKLEFVVHAIKAAGYDPYAQLVGYVTTGNAAYITRKGGARRMVDSLDEGVILSYLMDCRQKRSA